ncbi:hypothetical protein HanIR_Chr16g0791221 [Helianthus annuus]|nr:hypothetical protein HanIR_Chr16g0791221 [Helianthus annuus]
MMMPKILIMKQHKWMEIHGRILHWEQLNSTMVACCFASLVCSWM